MIELRVGTAVKRVHEEDYNAALRHARKIGMSEAHVQALRGQVEKAPGIT